METKKKMLDSVNAYIEREKNNVNTFYQGDYHFKAPVGWINDPNGFVFFKGEYHLFYQYHPYDTIHGPMHWGHAKSKDLISWEHLPVALAPDESYDQGGCFSGSAIEKDGKLYVMYTGNLPGKTEKENRQVQCVAVSEDGIHFEKVPQNPVLTLKDLPSNAMIQDFRDPKVFRHEDYYYSVIASCTKQNTGQILLYESIDLIDWSFKSILLEGTPEQGIMWECPDLFELDGKDVLILSPMRMKKVENDFHNISSSVVFWGSVDWQSGKFQVDSLKEIDHGLDFYAPQTTLDDKGRRIMATWMQMWDRNIPTHTENHGWAGSMALPRELSIKEGSFIQKPTSEIKEYYHDLVVLEDIVLDNEQRKFDGISGNICTIELVLDMKECSTFGMKFFSNDSEETVMTYTVETNELGLDRSKSGYPIVGVEPEPLLSRKVLCPLKNDLLKLNIFLDKSSVELFANDGEETITATVFPLKQAKNILFFSEGKTVINYLRKATIHV